MKKNYCAISFMLFLLLGISSCSKKTQQLKVFFTNTYGGKPFSLDSNYIDGNGYLIKFSRIKYLLSNIRLVKNDNSEVTIKETAYVSIEEPSTNSFTVNNVDGQFKAIKIGVGLNPTQNNTDPLTISDYSNPLSPSHDMWWSSTLKYVFMRQEGFIDTSLTGTKFNHSFLYHIGLDAFYKEITLAKTLTLTKENASSIFINIDWKEFTNQPNGVNTFTENTTHSDDKPAIAQKIINKYETAFSIQ